MVIAINTKYFLKAYQQDYSTFIYNCFSRMANQMPQHTFIFFSNSDFDPSFRVTENSIPLAIMPKNNVGVRSGILYNLKINILLKKYKATVFINADGFCSLFTKVPQCFILHNPQSLSNKQFIKKNRLFFYQKFMPSFLKRAKVIVTDSQFSKDHLIQHYKTGGQKPGVIYNAASDLLTPVEWQEKEKIKAQYAGGNEYFIFFGDSSAENILLNLLKAFSHFKKWQKSEMQLLIVEKDGLPKNFTESLALFKYRKDVKLLNGLSQGELAKVTAAAYCMIYFPLYESFSIAALEAIRCNIPVITAKSGAIPEIFGDAVLYINFDDPVNIAEKLILIFKDENLRQELIEKGMKEGQKYNWEKITALLWHSILKAAANPLTLPAK